MSDSDETVCGNESGDENTENSPSILSNWHRKETVFSKEKDEENSKTNSVNQHDRMVGSPEPEISPEFPLLTRGIKRKDGCNETNDEAPPIAKDVQNFSSSESDNISNTTTTTDTLTTDEKYTQSTDEKRLERLLKNVEDFVKDTELASEESGTACDLGGLQNAKWQLEEVQKLLGETNRKNQAERKMILSEAEDTRQLPVEKKFLIVNLAGKQRNLLEAFKKYKNLVQRLKTKAVHHGSVKLLQSQSKNLSQMRTQSVPTQPTNAVLVNNNRIITSKQPSVAQNGLRSMSWNPPLPQTQTTVRSQSTNSPAIYANTASTIQRIPHPSMLRPAAMNQVPVPSNRLATTQVYLAKTLPQSITSISHFSTPRQRQAIASRLSTNHVQTIGVPMPSFPRSKTTYQTTGIRPSDAPNLELSLETLVRKGVLVPGKNVLTTVAEGKLYSASLSDKGTIISAGGEGFASPRSWVKAILGSKRKVKNEVAWKMVSYKNKPLLDHSSTLTPELKTSVSGLNEESRQAQGTTSRSATKLELITTTRALKALLSNCRVIGITKEEVFRGEKTQKEVWDDADTQVPNNDILKALDF